jgi:hypothetical protein
MKRILYFLGLCLVLTVGLYGCGGSTTADSGQPAAQAKSAKVNFNVTFPQKNAVKSLIPQGTASITIYWSSYDTTSNSSAWGELTLYPDATTNTAKATAEMVPGFYFISANCTDASGSYLSSTSNYAQVGTGTNDIVITFLQGRWTFVNSTGVATPITLSGTESLSSFDINSPSGDTYPIDWNVAGSATALHSYLTYRSISGDLSQLTTLATYLLPSVLPTGAKRIDVFDTFYNFSNPAQTTRGSESLGDRIFMFASVHPALIQYSYFVPTITSTTDMNPYFNAQIITGTKLTGTIVEYTVGDVSTPTDTGKACTPSYPHAVVKPADSLARKALLVGTGGTVTETYSSCQTSYPTYTYTEFQQTKTYSNVNVYPFTAMGADLPRGSILPKK